MANRTIPHGGSLLELPSVGPAGTTIARLSDPFALHDKGVTTYERLGSANFQLALSGNSIKVGTGSATIGQSYSITVRAVRGDGEQDVTGTFAFKADGRKDAQASGWLDLGVWTDDAPWFD